MKNLTYTIDMIFAFVFGGTAFACLYGAIAKGAWWHLVTTAICAVVCVALLNDARKEAAK